ncbi:MAG TPA: type II CAAX endopeptidase family protein [Vitreimonas sp.]|uniref:CPBP family intramembrane glutamic endopeptidase n=1 Tax=Vitreimonas sp. TaxID=3069702 RepID=UPI002D2691A0|nr:type II CAAX endopeptidase family protein [Vitreimonas sp.]HYD86955.1 type II CAAX endopeptidase family protein [Vitreimonas sp.]
MRFALVYGDPGAGRAPAEPHGWGAALGAMIVASLLLGLISSVALLIGIVAMGYEIGDLFGDDQAAFGAARLIAECIAYTGLGWFVIRTSGRSFADLGLNVRALVGGLPWVLAGVVVAIPTMLGLFALPAGWPTAAASALPVLAPPVLLQSGVEEILFRGVIMAALAARYGALRGVLISAVIFSLWHFDPSLAWQDVLLTLGSTFVFGVTSALLVLRQGHLGGAIALHAMWNLTLAIETGLARWPEPFWETFGATVENAPTEAWDPSMASATLLPLAIETAIVLTAVRFVFADVLADRGRARLHDDR